MKTLVIKLIAATGLLALMGCETMQGVNVGTGMSLPGGVGVRANKTIGSGAPANPSSKKSADKKDGDDQDSEAGAADKEQAAVGPGDELRLYVFDCGRISTDDISSFGLSNEDTKVRELFVPCYLVEHPKGRLLWDGGLPLALAGKGPVEEGGFVQEYKVSLIDQLAAMGLTPQDIDYVAFSHMHFDHVGAANAFGSSQLLIQEVEYDAAFRNYKENPYFTYELYSGLADSTKTLLRGDHDVFGDGSVQIISTPGHTPGHQVLFLQLANIGPLVLSGDLYHFVASRKKQSVPTFNTNKEQTLASMTRLEALIAKKQATLWIEHNMALAMALNLAPSYYN